MRLPSVVVVCCQLNDRGSSVVPVSALDALSKTIAALALIAVVRQNAATTIIIASQVNLNLLLF
jgi:hypothetical protein